MKTYKIAKFVLFILLGISIFFLKNAYIENLHYFIGGLITLYGIDGAFLGAFENDKEQRAHYFFKAIVELILGVCTIILFADIKVVCVIWAVWAIMREAEEIEECFQLFEERIPCLLNFAESIIAIVFSILLINEPGEHHAMVHMYLLIVELWTTVLFPQARFAYVKYIKKEKEE